MKAEFTDFNTNSNWVEGVCGEYRFQAKLFDEGSEFGIDEGRVSKLAIQDANGDWVVNYDRGWDIEPIEQYKDCYTAIMELLENSPKRFEY